MLKFQQGANRSRQRSEVVAVSYFQLHLADSIIIRRRRSLKNKSITYVETAAAPSQEMRDKHKMNHNSFLFPYIRTSSVKLPKLSGSAFSFV